MMHLVEFSMYLTTVVPVVGRTVVMHAVGRVHYVPDHAPLTRFGRAF